jgi:hypothetical protein
MSSHYFLVLPESFPFWQTFIELRRGIGERLKRDGHCVYYCDKFDPDFPLNRQILFGANNCPDSDFKPGCIVYQSESSNSYWLKKQSYIDRLAQASEIWGWDTHAPYPFDADDLTHAPKVPGRVVHFGFLSPRRTKACFEVGAVPVCHLWGEERNRILDSAELVIELLFEEDWDRCSLRMLNAASRGLMMLSECDVPERRLDPSRIKEQVAACLAMSPEEKLKWRMDQRQTVIDWLKVRQ